MLATLLLMVQVVQPAPRLPEPFATPWFRQGPRVVAQPPEARISVPDGFRVNVFAEGLRHARKMALAPNGDVYVGGDFRICIDTPARNVAR